MKKSIFTLFVCLLSLTGILLLSALLTKDAQIRFSEIQVLISDLPELSDFKNLNDEQQSALRRQVKEIESELKKAGDRLAFFINYEYLNRAYSAAAALCQAIHSMEPADYSTAKATLSETVAVIEYMESFSLELVF